MNRQRTPLLLGLLLLTSLLGACVSSLPVDAPAPTTEPGFLLATPAPTVLAKNVTIVETTASVDTLDVQQPISETEAIVEATSSPAPPPTPSPTPTPALPKALELATVLATTLDYLNGVYLEKLPAGANFNSVEVNQDIAPDIAIVATYAKAPWQVSISDIQSHENGATRTVIVANESTEARWWGEVNDFGIVSITTEAGFTTPDPERVRGWVGQIVKLPEGSPHDDYFISEGRGIHGIDSLDPALLAELERYQDQSGLVKVFGILLYGVDDYNGRQLLINQLEHRDGPVPDPLPDAARSDITTDQADATPTFYGPTGALTNALPGSILQDSVSISGQAEAVFEDKVIVQIEDGDGNALGQAIVQLAPSTSGSGGTFSVDVAFENPVRAGEGRIALYAEDPTDGSLMLLTWANIRYAGSPSELEGAILTPAEGEVIKKAVKVRGVVAGLPDSEVLIQVEDLTGTYWGRTKTPTNSAGEFSKTIKFRNPATARPGLVAIYEINPIDNSLKLLAAQQVRLVE